MLKTFKLIAILEGISYLLLLGVGMPLKYLANMPTPNIYIGYAHGFLFIAYVALALLFTIEKKQGFKRFVIYFIAGLLPFGTFYVERKYLRS
ncbi:DUF3817 domain-containing protein [Gangjinia marincola]|uniref:DUF3817 domain-containing protein n=1 Tax=Gangjinia marincola TaxID=578463 RepID=A0ABP3XS00_9FLAO